MSMYLMEWMAHANQVLGEYSFARPALRALITPHVTKIRNPEPKATPFSMGWTRGPYGKRAVGDVSDVPVGTWSEFALGVLGTHSYLNSWPPGVAYGPIGDPHVSRCLAFAADDDEAVYTMDGVTTSGRAAWDWVAGNLSYQDTYDTNQQRAFIPKPVIRNVRVAGTDLRWTAPDAGGCTAAVQITAFTDSISTSDTAATCSGRSCLVSLSGETSGANYYRITCGYGRALGTVIVP
jgi:hypothetical protein